MQAEVDPAAPQQLLLPLPPPLTLPAQLLPQLQPPVSQDHHEMPSCAILEALHLRSATLPHRSCHCLLFE